LRYDPPAAPAVRDTLDRVLSSETFRRSERARSLLAYLVDREQAGDGERLKGYTIAVDVFGRDAEFDASTDALVRVQAGRLRELLAQYYQSEGATDAVRILIPRGGYAPSYEQFAPCPDAIAEPRAAEELPERPEAVAVKVEPAPQVAAPVGGRVLPRGAAGMGQVRLLWGALALVATALLAVILLRTGPIASDGPVATAGSAPTAAAADAARADALPTIRIVARGDDPAVDSAARHFRAAFAGFDTLATIGGEFSQGLDRMPADPAGFVLSLAEGPDKGSVAIDLQSLGTGKVLLNRLLSPGEADAQAIEDEVASIATSVAPVTGVIYGYLKQAGLTSGLVKCMTLSDAYYMDQTPAKHATAYRCLERLVDTGSASSLVYSELAGLHVEAKTDGYYYPAEPNDEQAMVLARKGVQLGPTSPFAHRAMGFLYSRRGDTRESVRWMRKAYELNTYDLSMAASYGYALVFAGDYSEGAAILERAVEASSSHPTWWDYSLFLARFMLNDMDAASRASDPLVSPRKSHYLAARLIVAHWRGDERSAGSLATELVATYPKFATDPATVLRDAKYPADLAGKLVDALKTAGLGGAS
jgi:Flp pilus assembly protein TadD